MLAMLWGWDQAHKHAKFWIKSETGIFGQHLNLMFWTNYESRLRHVKNYKAVNLDVMQVTLWQVAQYVLSCWTQDC